MLILINTNHAEAKKPPPGFPKTFLGKKFKHPQYEIKDWTPIKYFNVFWKDDLNELRSEQSNLYSVQQNGKFVADTPGGIEQVIGLQMYTSIDQLLTYNMYWESLTRSDTSS